MAKRKDNRIEQAWSEAEALFARGEAAFVDRLRCFHNADILAAFTARWFADRRPEARRMLRDYLSRPLNAYRHEVLVKRLFKMSEAANDDEIMAYFLVLFDRSVRRVKRRRWDYRTSDIGERMIAPRNTMPQNLPSEIPQPLRDRLARKRLFSVHTRNYLRRRVWRYFRTMGKTHPQQYVKAVSAALILYEDADVADGAAFLDNWGLIQALFHHSAALVAKPHGWTLAQGRTLAELQPAPRYEALWLAEPRAVFELLRAARCRPVRQWAIRWIRREPAALRDIVSLEEWLNLLFHEDSEVAALAVELLRFAPGLSALSVERWLSLLETTNVLVLETLCEMIVAHVQPERVSLADAVRLACSRPLPLARLGFRWLQARRPADEGDCRSLLQVAAAEAEALRAEMIRWVRGVLSASPHFQPEWLLEFLDSRHADVRIEAWTWLETETRARENIDLWQRLLESPYDDVRLRLAAALEERVRGRTPKIHTDKMDTEMVHFLWASVLLNIHRGGRTKPQVVTQLVQRLERKPEEAKALLPILAAALRSVRGPEWRAGLSGVVALIHRKPELVASVNRVFPELKCL
jgi:hypothetical protein